MEKNKKEKFEKGEIICDYCKKSILQKDNAVKNKLTKKFYHKFCYELLIEEEVHSIDLNSDPTFEKSLKNKLDEL